jgi:type I site-specific restriction-modification system R (restriction) subunit
MTAGFTESDAEEAALGWLETLGYTVRHGPEIAVGVDGGERSDPGYHDTILHNRLHRALTRLNAGLPTAAVFDAYRKLLRVEAPNLLARNRTLHRMLVDGVSVIPGLTGRLLAPRPRSSISSGRSRTIGWRSISSPSSKGSRAAAPTL